MAIQEFVRPNDLKNIIDNKLLQNTSLKHILKQKGIIPICTKSEHLSNLVYNHFFSSNTLSKIQDVMNLEKNNIKSTVVIISPKKDEDTQNFLNDLTDEISYINRMNFDGNEFKNILSNSSSLNFEHLYKKPQKGKISLLKERTITTNISVTPIKNTNNFKVNIQHEGTSESKKFITLLEDLSNKDNSILNLERIRLDSLTKQHKIDFFDKFNDYCKTEWTLKDIVDISFDAIDNVISTNGTLSGITSAILKGEGLRSNSFVKDSMEQDFVFTSMSYKFEKKDSPLIIILEVNFKHTDLKINIVKTYEQDDKGKPYISTIPSIEQQKYIDYFQNKAYDLYSNLLKEQEPSHFNN